MIRYIIRRLILVIPTVLLAGTLVFFLLRVLPGDVVTSMTSEGGATPETKAKLREELGLNDPVIVQYGRWLKTTLSGDLGYSHFQDRPVTETVKDKIETTLTMAVLSMIISLAVAIPLGIISAVKRGSWTDQVIRIFTATGLAIPPFWLGMLIILVAVSVFNWTPPILYMAIYEDPFINLQQMMFPVFSAGIASAAVISRLTRSMMLETLYQDYIRTARAKGLLERKVVIKHAVQNAIIPVITMCGYHFSYILGGVVVIENVFNLPGLGRQLLISVNARDYDMIIGIVLALTIILSIWILITDLVYSFVDPRIRYQ
jgi:peptide/nickel transport system permease protein|tara:strand:- start:655 stop:1602 length:948 start_codon:yes stop_codon:yes gene_type:complete